MATRTCYGSPVRFAPGYVSVSLSCSQNWGARWRWPESKGVFVFHHTPFFVLTCHRVRSKGSGNNGTGGHGWMDENLAWGERGMADELMVSFFLLYYYCFVFFSHEEFGLCVCLVVSFRTTYVYVKKLKKTCFFCYDYPPNPLVVIDFRSFFLTSSSILNVPLLNRS